VWSGAMHSVSSAWPSTQHQMGVAWNYALCCISLAFYSSSDGCGLGAMQSFASAWIAAHQQRILLGIEQCTLICQYGPLLSIRWWLGWTEQPNYNCGLDLCSVLHQPSYLFSIWRCWGLETMQSDASFCYSALDDGCGIELIHSVASAWNLFA